MRNPDLQILYNQSMGALMKKECKKFNFKDGITFFSDEEFKKNEAMIFTISGAVRRLEETLKKLEDGDKKIPRRN